MAQKTNIGSNQLTRELREIKAKDIMTKYVITTTENATLAEVAEVMIKARVSGLPVTNKKRRIVGIITAVDLFIVMDMIRAGDVVKNGTVAVSQPTVKFAMSTEVIRITRNTTLNKIIDIMQYKNIHTLPVCEGNKLIGVIGRRDVFKKFYAAEKGLYL